jgi:hypothetical protein
MDTTKAADILRVTGTFRSLSFANVKSSRLSLSIENYACDYSAGREKGYHVTCRNPRFCTGRFSFPRFPRCDSDFPSGACPYLSVPYVLVPTTLLSSWMCSTCYESTYKNVTRRELDGPNLKGPDEMVHYCKIRILHVQAGPEKRGGVNLGPVAQSWGTDQRK